MNPTIERGLLLLQQGRHELAIEQFHQALAADPQLGFAHACIALCLAKQEKYAEASESAARAIEASPDLPFAHYTAASVFHDRHRLAEAERAVTEAIRLDPYEASYHGLAAIVRFEQSDWQAALDRATQGLAIDPDDAMCTNVRAMALVRLGLVADARTELKSSLSRQPENAWTHANLGWAALERGERQQALECFRESLRINPDLDWARSGMIHALKLRYPLYGLFLKYLLWIQKLRGRAQWGVIVGGYVAFQVMHGLAQKSPQLAPWLTPFLVLYMVFAYVTWVGRPLTNLFLRFNRFGRAILNDDERRESNYIGAILAIALSAGAIYLVTANPLAFLVLLLSAALVIPFSSIFRCQPGWPRKVSAAYAAAMSLLALSYAAAIIASEYFELPVLDQLTNPILTVYFIGTIAAPWVSNALITMRPPK